MIDKSYPPPCRNYRQPLYLSVTLYACAQRDIENSTSYIFHLLHSPMTWKCRLHFFLSMSVTIWSLPNQLFTQTNGKKKNRTIHKQIKNPKNKIIIEDRILSFLNLFSALSSQRDVKLLSILCPHKCKINTFRLRLKCSQNSLYLSLHSFSIFTFCCETQFGW